MFVTNFAFEWTSKYNAFVLGCYQFQNFTNNGVFWNFVSYENNIFFKR